MVCCLWHLKIIRVFFRNMNKSCLFLPESWHFYPEFLSLFGIHSRGHKTLVKVKSLPWGPLTSFNFTFKFEIKFCHRFSNLSSIQAPLKSLYIPGVHNSCKPSPSPTSSGTYLTWHTGHNQQYLLIFINCKVFKFSTQKKMPDVEPLKKYR